MPKGIPADIAATRQSVQKAAQTGKSRAHLITVDRGLFNKPVLTAHMASGVSSARDRRAALNALRSSETGLACRVKQHSQRKIENAKTLETFVGRYGQSEIVFDPTQVVTRTRALVQLSRDLRARFTEKELIGTYWDSVERNVFVVLDSRAYFSDSKVKGSDLVAAEDRAKEAIETYLAHDGCIARSVLLSFEMPQTALTPVDEMSFFDLGDAVSSKSSRRHMGAIAALIGAVGATSVAADPAVSQFNSKLSFQSSSTSSTTFGDNDAGLLAGSATVGIGHRFGAQIDGVLGRNNDDTVSGLGAHLFWRDPSVAMIGITAGSVDFDRTSSTNDQTIDRFGLEVEYYVGDFTIYAAGGRQSGSNVLEGDYGSLGLGWYASDNLQLTLDFQSNPDVDRITTLGVEWQPTFNAANNVSIFADASTGSDDYKSVSVGFRMYFGSGSKPLNERHRLDDPQDNVALGIVTGSPNSLSYGTGK